MAMKAIFAAVLAVTGSAFATHADPIDPAQVIAQKFSDASEEPAPKPTPKIQAAPTKSPAIAPAKPDTEYEADMLSRARQEQAERTNQQQSQKSAVKPAPIAAPVPPPVTAPQKPPAPAVAALPPTPEIERSAVSARNPRPSASQATVLLVLDTDGDTSGIKPDPIICTDDLCWISSGMESPAAAMPRTKAQALKTTEDATPDSCAGKSACVYRGITIEDGARIAVIEAGESRGASSGAFTIAPDKSCRKDAGGLVCDNGLATHDFRIWVVPEALAASIGPAGLEDAVAEGLPDSDAAASNDK